MKKIAIIGASYLQNPLILKAKEMGLETHVFAWKSGDIGEKTADCFYPISITEKDEILEQCEKIGISAVCSIASDLAVLTVNYVAEKLGLCGNGIESSRISTNKYLMRTAFTENNVSAPLFYRCSSVNELPLERLSFPMIVKPTDRSGSRAITKVNNSSELPCAVSRAVEASFEKKAVVEEYIEGNEYSCECISFKGEHHFLALTKKYTTGSPHFIETGHVQPSDIPLELQSKIITEIFRALDALKIQNGASHSEFRIKPDGSIGIIEIGSRMGGDCIGSNLVRLSTGYDFVRMVIDVSLGNAPDFTVHTHYEKAGIKYIFNSSDLDILEADRQNKNILIQYESEIDRGLLGSAEDSSSRAGYYIWSSIK